MTEQTTLHPEAPHIHVYDRESGDIDDQYGFVRKKVEETFRRAQENDEPIFITEQTKRNELFDLYLYSLPTDQAGRQIRRCACCRDFFHKYAGLVTITEDGNLKSAIWDTEDAVSAPFYASAVKLLKERVESSKIFSVFADERTKLGTAESFNETGEVIWTHFAVEQPEARVVENPHPYQMDLVQDYQILSSGLGMHRIDVAQKTLQLFVTEQLHRSKQFMPRQEWFVNLKTKTDPIRNHRQKSHLIWKAVATAPVGWARFTNGALAELMKMVARNSSLQFIQDTWGDMVDGENYQRAKAEVKEGNIKQAEKLIKDLGLETALKRRFATFESIPDHAFIWKPAVKAEPEKQEGVFGHLKPKAAQPATLNGGTVEITFSKFQRVVLPTATEIYLHVAMIRESFFTIVTATDPDAKPIIKWDHPEARNPFSWYLYNGGSIPVQFNLQIGQKVPVKGITAAPPYWNVHGYHGAWENERYIFVEGAKDMVKKVGLALFPEVVISELHSVRNTIEHFSNEGTLDYYEEGNASGIVLSGQGRRQAPIRLEVTTNGVKTIYDIYQFD